MKPKTRLLSLGLLGLFAVIGCDTTGYQPRTLPDGLGPDGSGDVNIRTPGTPGASNPKDVQVDVDLNDAGSPTVGSNTPSGTLSERRAERRERIGEAIDGLDINVDAGGADVSVD